MLYQAHRGVCTECPENTMPAFRKAVAQGYGVIEMDPRFTSDNVCVLHHDPTLNRTCRTPDGKVLPEPIRICDVSFAQLRMLDAGLWFGEAFRGTKVPTLAETLAFAKESRVHVKLDNVFATFSPEQQSILFALVEASGADVGFTCANPETVSNVVARFPNATIHYDGPVSEESMETVKALLKNNPLVTWIPADVPQTAWCKVPKASPQLCRLIKKYGKLGIWIIRRPEDLKTAEAMGADIIETPGELKP